MLPVLSQHVIGFAATAEMSGRLLHAVVLTPSVADGAGMDSCRSGREEGNSGTAEGQTER